ncbi:hypothetical protein [Tistlia consotensis]|nr:hypothetical protein [Tistlia consotensis]
MTAVREGDGLRAVQQYGGGPARSLFGLEPNTVHSLLDREIRSDWVAKILARLILHPPFDLTPAGSDALLEHLTWNPWLACAVARLKYWTVPKALPAAGAWRDLAAYWKQWFNTAAGAGTVEKFLASNAATIEYFEFIRRGQA